MKIFLVILFFSFTVEARVQTAFAFVNRIVLPPVPTVNTWIARTSPASAVWYDVFYGNGLYVGVGNGGRTMRSADGVTWIATTVSGSNTINGVVYGAGLFVIAKSDGTPGLMSSPDGINWTNRGPAVNFYEVAYDGTNFVASGAGIYTSPDGITWTARTFPTLTVNIKGFATNGTGKWCAISYSTSTRASISTDGGVTWTAKTTPTAVGYAGIAYGNGNFVAVGTNGGAYSTDGGETWTASSISATPWQDIEFSNGLFVAVSGGSTGASTVVGYSTDGVTWNYSTIQSQAWFGIGKGLGLFVAVGSGVISTSSN